MAAETLQNFAMGMSAISSSVSGIAQWMQGRAEQKGYDYNAKIAERQTAEEIAASRQKYSRLRAEQRLLYAKAGVDMSSGSPLLVMMDTALEQSEEAARISKAGREEAGLQRFYGRVANYRGKVAGISTFLTGLGRTATDYYKWKKGV